MHVHGGVGGDYAVSNMDAVRRYRERHPERYKANKAAAYKRWREKNKEKHAQRNREWYQKNPGKVQDNVLKQKFGITKEIYDSMLSEQNGVCAICEKTCKSGRRLAVDHCHSTGKVRGLLCIKCNNTLGKVDDNVNILRRMIGYLEN